MTKNDLVEAVCERTGQDKREVLQTVEATMYIIKSKNSKGTSIFLRGFGSFTAKLQATKTARNITKATEIIIPARYKPAFKPAPDFNRQVAKLPVIK